MSISAFFSKIIGFRTLPTTFVVVVLYLAIFISVFLTDEPAKVPKNLGGLSLQEAYADLRNITAHPHPYNSHANDLVHDFILERVNNITSGYSYAHVDNDLNSTGSWASASRVVYFEGTNILVKIDGTDKSASAVLLSAHYDSVSTAPGATDDGMSVATLIQLVHYFTHNRPKRTVVFNINNGEEDWLNGAHAFLEHKWSNLTTTFLNLEGAAAGGRPVLFRVSGSAPTRAFLSKHVPHPHANVAFQDAFSRGAIRSGTDFSVYTDAGMQGLDFAFYKGRARYHTKYDAIPYTHGGERALWAMMETAKGAATALANDDSTHDDSNNGSPVYLDLFGSFLVIFPLRSLFVANILLLVIGPVILILLFIVEAVVLHNRRHSSNGAAPGSRRSVLWQRFISLGWLTGFWLLAKFWITILAVVALQGALVYAYLQLNPAVVYSFPNLVLLSFGTLAYLSLVLFLNIPLSFKKWRWGITLPEQQKHITLRQTFVFTWILLLFSTIAVNNAGIGSTYFITVWNAALFVGCLISALEGMLRSNEVVERERIAEVPELPAAPAEEWSDEATERTPLIQRRPSSSNVPLRPGDRVGAIGWWLLQILVVVPIPVALIAQLVVLVVGGINQTITDGNSIATVYGAVALLSFLLVLPIAPFTFKLSNRLTLTVFVIFAISTLTTFFTFPFQLDSPFKIYFKQELVQSDKYPQAIRAHTTLSGLESFLRNDIIPQLPSANGKTIKCKDRPDRPGLTACTWDSGSDLLPNTGFTLSSDLGHPYVWVHALRGSENNTASITISGKNSRGCRLYFENQSIIRYSVKGSNATEQRGYKIDPEKGIQEVRLWSRSWDRSFTVDVEWKPTNETKLRGKAGCGWTEYESGSTGVSTGGRIPAFEEVLTWLPQWATVSKADDGLVEVTQAFSV